jgi:hypothetical protein
MVYDNIFVLSAGRSGSTTFAQACKKLSNYTSLHESRSALLADNRFAYPLHHIEVDNRLCWFLGEMDIRFNNSKTLYVNLVRDPERTAMSFLNRLRTSKYKSSIIRAFAYGIVMKAGDWKEEEEPEIARFYLRTVTLNIDMFLKDKNSLVVHLEDDGESFDAFLQAISAEGDLDGARSIWREIHNADSQGTHKQ